MTEADVNYDYIYEDLEIPLANFNRTTILPAFAVAKINYITEQSWGDGAKELFYSGLIGILPYQSLPYEF
jgi:hypothetical protein